MHKPFSLSTLPPGMGRQGWTGCDSATFDTRTAAVRHEDIMVSPNGGGLGLAGIRLLVGMSRNWGLSHEPPPSTTCLYPCSATWVCSLRTAPVLHPRQSCSEKLQAALGGTGHLPEALGNGCFGTSFQESPYEWKIDRYIHYPNCLIFVVPLEQSHF